LYVGEEYSLLPLALNRNNEVVQGARMTWNSNNSAVVTVSPDGDVKAVSMGHATLLVQSGTAKAQVAVEVRAGSRRRQSDTEWDEEHANDCDQPESSQLLRDEKGDTAAMADASSDTAADTEENLQPVFARRPVKAALRTPAPSPRLAAKTA